MKYFLFGALCLMEVLLSLRIVQLHRGRSILHKAIIRLMGVAVVTVFTQGIFLMCNTDTVAQLSLACYYASIDWLVLALLSFVEVYAETFKGTRAIKHTFFLLATIDGINLILNVFFQHVFRLNHVLSANDYYVWAVENDSLSFYLHLLFTYIIVIFCALSLLTKTIQTPSLYRWKFSIILMMFALVVILNAICIAVKSPYDFSVFLYCLFGMQVCHYALYFKPKLLIDRTLYYVADEIKDALFCFDIWGNCVFVNRIGEETFRVHENSERINNMFREWFESSKDGIPEETEYEETRQIRGEERTYKIVFRKLVDKKERYIGGFFTIRDRTDELERFKKEHYNVTHDKLTGIYNREYFFEKVEKLMADNPDEDFCMVCSDIKGFKLFNELFGARVGDEVLKMEAELLRKDAGKGTVYGRIEGDEFAIVVPICRFGTESFIRNINLMKERFTNDQYQMHIHVGVYKITNREEPISVMCDKAKLAIESHRGDYNAIMIYYDERLLDKSLYERKIVGEFDRAIDNKEFIMYLQPQIASDESLLGAEALVRWQHPERGLVFPGDFIEVFEKTGLIYRLDRYMWELAALKLRDWKAQGKEDLHISVNISAKDFYYMDIYREFTKLVEKYDISPKNMKLEITETVLMTEMKSQLDLLARLREYGFQLEIDDFGSGYSSLNMLKNIDVDVVKIDMGFLDETEHVEKGNSILNSMIHLVKNLGMGVITEGVETGEQVEILKDMGCNMFQGYYFAKPMPVAAFEKQYWV